MNIAPPTPDDLARLAPAFTAYPMHSEITIAGKIARFPHAVTANAMLPADWLASKHAAGSIHEPALVAWLFALGAALAGRTVRFFDIGAAFGYFSALASCAFEEVEITAVEPNPALAAYVEMVLRANAVADAKVENVLVSDSSGALDLAARNFHYLPHGEAGGEAYRLCRVETRALSDLLGAPGNATDILKIDTEGWQAQFLPPASQLLIRRKAIVLLECDALPKLTPFGRTNAQIVSPFLEFGYRLMWCDHRDPAFEVAGLAAFPEANERNSLAVLLPPD
ncbi:MAG: FkbM family methyltransferase [Altererythrobacter sp.]